MRPVAVLSAMGLLAACASGPQTHIETTGVAPASAQTWRWIPGPTEDAPTAALAARASDRLAAHGWQLADSDHPARANDWHLGLGWSAAKQTLGVYRPRRDQPSWAVRPEKRGFLAPGKTRYQLQLALYDGESGLPARRVAVTRLQKKGQPGPVFEAMLDQAIEALFTVPPANASR